MKTRWVSLLTLVVVVIVVVTALVWFAARSSALPVDSSSPAFTGPAERVAWIQRRIRGSAPSAIRDAHFLEEKKEPTGSGHMGPGQTMVWLYVKIEIDPVDAPAWADRTQSSRAPRWRRDRNPLHRPTAAWSMDPADFDGAQWFDPRPLFYPGTHHGYQDGYMAITDTGTTVYIWQHWRG